MSCPRKKTSCIVNCKKAINGCALPIPDPNPDPLKNCLRAPNWSLLQKVNEFDRSFKVRYISDRPNFAQYYPYYLPDPPFKVQYEVGHQYHWNSNVIPSQFVDPIPSAPSPPYPPGTPQFPNGDAYDKFRSISAFFHFYAGFDFFNVNQDDPRSTLFVTNLDHRGPDNYLKKVYMNATKCSVMDYYKEKTNQFINSVFTLITVKRMPVLSTFFNELITFFLDLHLGYADHPDYVVKYFKIFAEVVAIEAGDQIPTPARNEMLMYGWTHVDCVINYIAQRVLAIEENQDTSTIAYWWLAAGLPTQSVISEALHNMVAFLQFLNTLYLIIRDKVEGTPVPPSTPPTAPNRITYDFFGKYATALTETDKLNVTREMYRLLVPNSASFSHIIQQNPTTPWIESYHLHQLIMIEAYATQFHNPGAYYHYDTTKYTPFNTDFTCTCPMGPTGPIPIDNPASQFITSPVDNQTVLDICNPKMMPVYPTALYAPFGFGYRRCAGEFLAMMIGMKLLERFKDVSYVFKTPDPNGPLIPLAPFVRVPDNLFVVQ
jgi:hypothetical protein